uniref:restriction endonuclease subunit S n=1 Tax=uncultured Altererythrobacter sp. TaxID=500840 RepID=UPI00262D9A1C|nr:restriction endonuclease subunit S [uncultured Altererythrobacter sp.]
MSEWIEHTLGEVCSRLRSGSNITAKNIHESGSFPVFGGNGIRGYASEANFSGECAIIGRQGAYCGNVRYFKGEARMSEHAVVACAGPSHHTRFLAYLLSNMNLGSLSGQAAQPGLSVKVLAQQSVRMPRLETQKRIAEILGAYDDLIEVNRRRVAILEEMARGLFEEWFVRFRFPGHEAVEILGTPDGPLPEGWSRVELGSLLYLHYGKALKADARIAEDIPVIGSSGVVGHHNEAYARGPGIVVGRKGNVGSIIWSTSDFWPIDTTYFVETKLPLIYVFELLRRVPFQNTDAAVPGLNRDYALSRKVISAPEHLVAQYGDFAVALREQLDGLETANAKLAASRDLLLPRLISGQLSVEDAESELEDAA